MDITTTKDTKYILNKLEKRLETTHTIIEILNEKSHQELHDLELRDRNRTSNSRK